jgi:hypothetical protein
VAQADRRYRPAHAAGGCHRLPDARTGRDGTVTGRRVRIHNRRQRMDFPFYTDGGARAAAYTSVDDAVAAAVTTLRIEAAPTVFSRPR